MIDYWLRSKQGLIYAAVEAYMSTRKDAVEIFSGRQSQLDELSGRSNWPDSLAGQRHRRVYAVYA